MEVHHLTGWPQALSCLASFAVIRLPPSSPSVPMIGETTGPWVITVWGEVVEEEWRKQECWEWKEGVARLEFRPPFQACRKETLCVVTVWIGNISKIAMRHYLRVTPDDDTRSVI
jgi:hypothetical protein